MNSGARGPLLAITVVAAGLRVVGLDFGLPYLSNFYVRPDEALVVVPALRLFDASAVPGSLVYPALLPTLCAALFHPYFWIAGGSASSLAAHFAQDPSPYFVLARAISVTAGTVTALLVYLVGREFAPRVGLLAALLYAVAPLAVRDAHFGVTDTLMTMLATAAVYALLRYHGAAARYERRWLVLVAVTIGLAIAAKYPAGVLLALAGAVVIGKARPPAGRHAAGQVALLLVVSAVTFLIVNPGTVLRPRDTAVAVVSIVRAVSRHEGGWLLLPVLERVLTPLQYGPGELPGLVAAALGLGLAYRRGGAGRGPAAIVAGAVVVFLGPLLLARIVAFRYTLAALPFVAVLAAGGILGVRWPGPSPVSRWITALMVVVCVLPPLARAVWIDVLLARADTRSQAGRWIAAHVPADVPVVLLGGPECEPQIAESRDSIARRIRYAMDLYGPTHGRVVTELYRLQLAGYVEGTGPAHEVFRRPVTFERPARGVCLVIPSYRLPNPACPPAALPAGLADLARDATVRARFDPVQESAAGATIDVVDAFFLPFSRLWTVRRPGPSIEILLVPGERERP